MNLWLECADLSRLRAVSEGELNYGVAKSTSHFGSDRKGINWRHLDGERGIRVSDLVLDQSSCTLSFGFCQGELSLMLLI